MAVKATSRYSGDLLFYLQPLLLLQVEDFVFLRSVKREQQKQDFRIFNLAMMNRADCQSRETTSNDISFEAEGNESLNYGNGSRDRKRKDAEKEDSLRFEDQVDLRLQERGGFVPES